MCGGHFPGPGIEGVGMVYCCDKCADCDQNKMHMVAVMAPKVLGMLTIGSVIGYLLGRRRR